MALTDFNITRIDWFSDGPWIHEDDREEFEASGLECVVQRDRLGHWCGYVKLPTGHPWANKNPDQIRAQVYGGVKFVEAAPGKEGKWVGFACNEPGDLQPGMMKWKRETLSSGVYRDYNFVVAETNKLAASVKNSSK
jgi:hypothetical protein